MKKAELQKPPDDIFDMLTFANASKMVGNILFYDIWNYSEPEIYTEYELMWLNKNG